MIVSVARSLAVTLLCAVAGLGLAQEPQAKPAEKPGEKPAAKPASAPEEKPAAKPAPVAEEKPAETGEKPATAKPGPENARFQQVFKDWKALLEELRKLYEEYRVAEPSRRADIERQYAELIKKGEAMEPQVVSAAEKAYAEAPGGDPQLVEFLVAMVQNAVRRDDYEPAFRMATLLLDNHCPDKRLANWALYAAFCVGQYDAALADYKLARENNSFRPLEKSPLDSTIEQFVRDPQPFKDAWEREQKLREAEAKANDLPRVRLKTSRGDIVIELFENEAPNTVANFISLVEKGFYNGVTFHRVLDGFMAQGGCPEGTGRGGPGYHIPCECYQANRRQHFRGTLSMAHAGRDTGGSQFFLTFVPTTHLDTQIDPKTGKPVVNPQTGEPLPGHTVFGRVIEGMDVLAKIRRRNPEVTDPPPADRIVKAEVIRKRDHAYVPKKVE